MKKYIFLFLFLFSFFLFSNPRVFADLATGQITEDTTIGPENNPYDFINTGVHIHPGVTLTVLPGVEFLSTGFYNEGTLNALGTESSRINFNNTNFFTASLSTTNISYADFDGADAWFANQGAMNVDHTNISNVDATAFSSWHYPATLNLSYVNFSNINGSAIEMFQGIPLVIDHSTFDTGQIGILITDGSSLDADHLLIKNQTISGIESLNDAQLMRIKNSEITQNNVGIYASVNEQVDISGNSIHGNTMGAKVDSAPDLDFSGNWWGSASGPTHASNPGGTGDAISDNIIYSNFLTEDPFNPTPPPPPTKDPVILIPGIMGSELNKNYGDFGNIWANIIDILTPGPDSFLNDLSLNLDGSENSSFPMTVGDIIRHTMVGFIDNHVFDGMISTLELGGYMEGTDLFVFPYDWRKDNSESALLLKNKIEQVLAQTGKTKVDIIAHSMGGLVAKKYIADNGANSIDQLIFLGTPHLGAPKAFKALMYGDDMGGNLFGKIHFLNPNRVKIISQNMPATYQLLPSRKYVDTNGNKYVTDLVTQYLSGSGNNNYLLNYDDTNTFMINQGRNSSMIPLADNFHGSIDSLDLSGVNTYNFAGCGRETIGKITATKEKSTTSNGVSIKDDYKLSYTNGDDTVPLLSSVVNYGEKYYVKGFSHGSLPSGTGVPDTVLAILSGDSIPTFSNISTSINPCFVSGKVVSAHSPVSLDIYDSQNYHTGFDINGDIEYGIDGVSYDEIEGVKYAFLPEGADYRVVTRATDTGAYDFYVEEIASDDTKTAEYYWNEVPLDTLNANAEIDITSGSQNYEIKIDEDGDSVFEKTLMPSSSLSGAQSLDTIPPQTSVTTSGQTLALDSTDDNSGVLKTEYSTDNTNWNLYTKSFSTAGTVYYFSTDNAGNIEAIKSVDMPTPPSNPPSSGGGGHAAIIFPQSLDTVAFIPHDKGDKGGLINLIPSPVLKNIAFNPPTPKPTQPKITEQNPTTNTLSANAGSAGIPIKAITIVVSVGIIGWAIILYRKFLLK